LFYSSSFEKGLVDLLIFLSHQSQSA